MQVNVLITLSLITQTKITILLLSLCATLPPRPHETSRSVLWKKLRLTMPHFDALCVVELLLLRFPLMLNPR